MSSSSSEYAQSRRSSYALLPIYINIALYATCFQIQKPLEPFLVEKLGLKGNSDRDYAVLQSFFSIMQTLGSLVAGPFLDRFGAKGGFVISFLASALGYFLLSRATSLNLLYMSKIPSIFQAGYMCGQLAISQATTDGADRVLALGRLSMSYTIGSVLGPALGGFLGASGDYYMGARIAVVGSFISVLITFLMPASNNISENMTDNNRENDDERTPFEGSKLINDTNMDSSTLTNSNTEESDNNNSSQSSKITVSKSNSTSILQSLIGNTSAVAGVVRIVWLLLSVKIISSVANSMMSETFPLVLKNIFKLREQSVGLVLAANSAFNGVVNGLFLAPMVAYSGGDLMRVISLCLSSMAALALCLSALSYPPIASIISPLLSPLGLADNSMYLYISFAFIISIFQYALSTTITGQSTSMVKKTQKGTLLGVEHSFFALARVVAPQVGVMLLLSGGVSAVTASSGAIYSLISLLWRFSKHTIRSPQKNVCGFTKEGKQGDEAGLHVERKVI